MRWNFLDKTNALVAMSTMGLNKVLFVGRDGGWGYDKIGDGAEGASALETNSIQLTRSLVIGIVLITQT